MKKRITLGCVALSLFALCWRGAAAAPEIWRWQNGRAEPWELTARLAKIDAESAALPAELKLAAEFQKTFLKIRAGAKESEWLPEMERYSAAGVRDPAKADAAESPGEIVARCVADVARAWIARSEMQRIDKALMDYYKRNVEFPARFSDVENELPKPLRVDPWGDAWAYQAHAAAALGSGFAKFATQRYRLGPARQPELGSAAETFAKLQPQWKIAVRTFGASKALEFRPTTGNSGICTVQPGGKVGECTLVFMGGDWALMAAADRLFVAAIQNP